MEDISTEAEALLQEYLNLTSQQIRTQLVDILQRDVPLPGKRQVSFNAVETLLCFGLFNVIDPHHYGGGNIDQLPVNVSTIATFFRRTPGSITSKMLNLDGSRSHSAHEEPLLFAYLASQPQQYVTLYKQIMVVARDLGLDEAVLPDFLHVLDMRATEDTLSEPYDLPKSTGLLLAESQPELRQLEETFRFGELLTEKLVERKIRLAQHRFAQEVLHNCGRTCVFCGFAPHTLPDRSGLLRASHIKPWAVCNQHERVNVHNGLAACPMHDAAFDQGFLTVDSTYVIRKALMLQESIEHDYRVDTFFDDVLSMKLILPSDAKLPAREYLEYHREFCFIG